MKILGVAWLPDKNVSTFKTNPPEEGFKSTKPSLLKKTAKLFDPVGFLAPFLIRAGVLLQEMWDAGLDWDDHFRGDLSRRVRTWLSEVEDLPRIKVVCA